MHSVTSTAGLGDELLQLFYEEINVHVSGVDREEMLENVPRLAISELYGHGLRLTVTLH